MDLKTVKGVLNKVKLKIKPKLKFLMFSLWVIVFTFRLFKPTQDITKHEHTHNYYFSCDSTEVIATITKLSKK